MAIYVREPMDTEDRVSESEFRTGELEVVGRIVDASNATLFGKIISERGEIAVVYKPISGERPLWDFPTGNLASREVAAYLFSLRLDLNLVPLTVMREGPFGLGAVQRWIDIDEGIDVIAQAQGLDSQLREMAFFDVLVNNTDRKFGHLLYDSKGKLYGCDHGVTFHTQPKLRTVLWQFAGRPLNEIEIARLNENISRFADIERDLEDLLNDDEISALNKRLQSLLSEGTFPYPSEQWPPVPWPPF